MRKRGSQTSWWKKGGNRAIRLLNLSTQNQSLLWSNGRRQVSSNFGCSPSLNVWLLTPGTSKKIGTIFVISVGSWLDLCKAGISCYTFDSFTRWFEPMNKRVEMGGVLSKRLQRVEWDNVFPRFSDFWWPLVFYCVAHMLSKFSNRWCAHLFSAVCEQKGGAFTWQRWCFFLFSPFCYHNHVISKMASSNTPLED